MRTLVTGGSGFIGHNLIKQLLRNGHEVYYTGTVRENNPGGTCLGYEFHNLDWSGLRIDALFHQAAIADTLNTNRTEMMEFNFHRPMLLFTDAIRAGCTQIVYASSCAVYGDVEPPFREDGPFRPLNVYAESKLAFDQAAKAFYGNARVVGLRYSNVYGFGEQHKGRMASMIWQVAQSMSRGQRPRLFEFGEQRRDFVYVKDIVAANLRAMSCPTSGVYNCGTGTASTFNEIIGVLNDLFGTSLEPEYIHNPNQAAYQNLTLCDMTNAERVLGYRAAWPLREGVADYLREAGLLPRMNGE